MTSPRSFLPQSPPFGSKIERNRGNKGENIEEDSSDQGQEGGEQAGEHTRRKDGFTTSG